MSQINRPPIGLQNLLGSKNFGDNPSELAQTVRPSVDLLSFWAQQTLQIEQDTVTTAGGGTVISRQIPADEVWGIVSVGFRCQVISALNDDFYGQITLRKNFGGTVDYLVQSSELPNQNQPYQNSTYWGFTWQPSQLVWLQPGTIINGIFLGSNLASKIYLLDSIYYRLKV